MAIATTIAHTTTRTSTRTPRIISLLPGIPWLTTSIDLQFCGGTGRLLIKPFSLPALCGCIGAGQLRSSLSESTVGVCSRLMLLRLKPINLGLRLLLQPLELAPVQHGALGAGLARCSHPLLANVQRRVV